MQTRRYRVEGYGRVWYVVDSVAESYAMPHVLATFPTRERALQFVAMLEWAQ